MNNHWQREAYFKTHFPRDVLGRLYARGPRYTQFSTAGPDGTVQYSHVDLLVASGEAENPLPKLMLAKKYLSAHVHKTRVVPAPRDTGEADDAHRGWAYHDELEFVVDMDLKDYDDAAKSGRAPGLRAEALGCACTSGACRQCWLLVVLARETLDLIGRRVLQLGQPLPVFSGSKGCHFWFGNERARTMTDAQRQRLARELRDWRDPAYLDTFAASTNKTNLLTALTRAFVRLAVAPVEDGGRNLLANDRAVQWLATHFLTPAAAADFLALAGKSSSMARWEAFGSVARAHGKPHAATRVVLEFMLPVVDEYLYHRNHTLRLPFSLHTRAPHRVALPLTDADLAAVDPATMPTAEMLAQPFEYRKQRVLFERGIAVLDEWLKANGYQHKPPPPPGGGGEVIRRY